MMTRFLSLLMIFSTTIFLNACGQNDSTKVTEGMQAPDFTLPDLDEKKVTLSELKGKSVVIRFWADWSGYAKSEMPEIEPIYKQLKEKGLVVLAVNVAQHPKSAKDFVNYHSLTYPVLADRDSDVAKLYGVVSVPATFFVNPQGVVTGRIFGEMDDGEFVAMLRKTML